MAVIQITWQCIRPMSCYHSMCLLAMMLLINFSHCIKSPDCSTCKEIVENFHKGLTATQKSNYGGGNTKWEENSLGSYAFSEVRLVEIMENLCESKSKECHTMLEEHEDLVESFWFKQFTKKTDVDFHTFLCIDNIKACCPKNTYGKDCKPCPGGVERPCLGNGKCAGEGTRAGTGKCKCNTGYTGDLCTDCKDGYYEDIKNDTHTVCKVCHIACKDSCTGAGPDTCKECKDGWLNDEQVGCKDIDECQEELCEDDQYCTNTLGSYTCFSCDASCTSCTGSGADKCNECKTGYFRHDDSGKCEDQDECSLDPTLCTKENEECVNTQGNYQCICSTGYEYKDKVCVKSPKEEDEEKHEETITEDKDEL